MLRRHLQSAAGLRPGVAFRLAATIRMRVVAVFVGPVGAGMIVMSLTLRRRGFGLGSLVEKVVHPMGWRRDKI
jgi:hypothetical protein